MATDPFREFTQKMKDEAEAVLAANPPAPPAPVPPPPPAPVPPPPPPPPPPVAVLPVAENVEFTLTEPTLVRFGADTRWVQKALAVGTHACVAATFGLGDPAFGVVKACQAVAAPPVEPPAPPAPPPAPEPPAPPPVPASDVIDAQGNVIVATYMALANAPGSAAAIRHKFGDPSTVADAGLPQCPALPATPWPLAGRPGTINFGSFEGANPNWQDGGNYESNAASVIVLEDDPNRTGVRELSAGDVSGPRPGVLGITPELHWGQGRQGEQGVNAQKFIAQGKTVRAPVATFRAGGRAAWDIVAVDVMADGLVITSPSNTGHNSGSCQLPAHLAPMNGDMSNGSEFGVICCWNKNTHQGELAFIAMVGLGDGGTPANPDSHPLKPNAPPNELHGWWGERRDRAPGMPTLGDIAEMIYLGSIALPDMHCPTSVSFTTGKNGASRAVPWEHESQPDGPGYMGTGADLTSPADITPLALEANRKQWMPGGGAYAGMAHGGVIAVTSKAERKVTFVDATPLWAYYEKMYLGARSDFDKTQVISGPEMWPYSFTKAPEQMPKVIKTVGLADAPVCVTTGKWGPRRAYIGFENGDVQAWALGDYPTKVGGPAGSPASIARLSTTFVGANVTCIARPQEHAGGHDSVYPAGILHEIIVCSRGERAIRWLRFNTAGTAASVVRPLRDKRLNDPIVVTDVGNHSSPYFAVFMCDFSGKAVRSYRYGPATLNLGFGAAQHLPLADGAFDYGGAYAVTGRPFGINACNIP